MRSGVKAFIREQLKTGPSDDPFSVFDIEDVLRKHKKWSEVLPRVRPYYAVKANPFPLLLDVLHGLGVRFDCASQHEITDLLARGVTAGEMIFSHPMKTRSSILHARSIGLDLMVFDSEQELIKLHQAYPSARLVLRLRVDDTHSAIRLGLKFGADLDLIEVLLKKSQDLDMNVMGLAFHVGSDCSSALSYVEAIKFCRDVFDLVTQLGFCITLLDIGGGWPGSIEKFEAIAPIVANILDIHFSESLGVGIIGKPGRYYCQTAFTLVTKIIGKKVSQDGTVNYYLNDGIYGSFWDRVVAHRQYNPRPLSPGKCPTLRKTMIWGPTCDSYDIIADSIEMSELEVDDHLVYEDMGAYSSPTAQYGFNGMPAPKVRPFVSDWAESQMKKWGVWPQINSKIADDNYQELFGEKIWYQKG